MSTIEPRLWLIDYITEDGDSCATVVKARTHDEAFELFRFERMGMDPDDTTGAGNYLYDAEYYSCRECQVYPLDPEPEGVGVVTVLGGEGVSRSLNYDSLVTRAVRASLREPKRLTLL